MRAVPASAHVRFDSLRGVALMDKFDYIAISICIIAIAAALSIRLFVL